MCQEGRKALHIEDRFDDMGSDAEDLLRSLPHCEEWGVRKGEVCLLCPYYEGSGSRREILLMFTPVSVRLSVRNQGEGC